MHPNYAATHYVWEKFTANCIEENTQQLMGEINEINAAMHHKPFNESSAAHHSFKAKYFKITAAMQQKHPYMNLTKELTFFSS